MITEQQREELKRIAYGDPLMHVGTAGREAIRAALDELNKPVDMDKLYTYDFGLSAEELESLCDQIAPDKSYHQLTDGEWWHLISAACKLAQWNMANVEERELSDEEIEEIEDPFWVYDENSLEWDIDTKGFARAVLAASLAR